MQGAQPLGAARPADRAVWGILASTGLVMALWQEWGLLHLLWPLWIQSVIIGWFSRRRILRLEELCTDGLKINDRPVDPTPETQRTVANFFGLHYGLFHLIYLGSLMFLPYLRVIPMHLAILVSAPLGATGAMGLFVLLKTAADVAMHKAEHHILQKAPLRS